MGSTGAHAAFGSIRSSGSCQREVERQQVGLPPALPDKCRVLLLGSPCGTRQHSSPPARLRACKLFVDVADGGVDCLHLRQPSSSLGGGWIASSCADAWAGAAMAGALRQNASLTSLHLGGCGVGPEGAAAIAAALLVFLAWGKNDASVQ